MKRKDKKFEYRDKSLAKSDWEWNKTPIFDLSEIAKAFAVPPSMLSKPKPMMVKQEISIELAEDSIVALEPFFANAFSDAFKSVAEGAESFSVTMKEFGDKIREGVQESVAKGLMEALTFDDIKNVMFEIDGQTKEKGVFQMSPEAFRQIQKIDEKTEERREREEQFEKLLRAAEGIERERNIDLLKIKKKIVELRSGDDDDVFFETGVRAMRVRERFVTGGVLVPNEVADQIQKIVGEKSIVRQVSRTIPMGDSTFRPVRSELLEASPIPIPADPDALAIVGEGGPELAALPDVDRYWAPAVNTEIPKGAMVVVDASLYSNPPPGWEQVDSRLASGGKWLLKKST